MKFIKRGCIRKPIVLFLSLFLFMDLLSVNTMAARMPEAVGSTLYQKSNVTIDASNVNDGYMMVNYSGSNPKVKMQVTKNNTYTYDIKARGTYEIFPFTEGDGSYQVKLFENVAGTQYAQIFSETINVSLKNPFTPYLYPNQYVNYGPYNTAVQLANQIAAGKSQLDIVKDVYAYVIANVSYDYDKAQTVQSGYLPNIDSTLATGKGICFDYAALMAAMLRSQDIPTRLVIGYTGSTYHAWVSVYIEGQGWIDNIIYFDGTNWSLMDPTFMSSSGGSENARQYVSNRNNYQEKYSY